MKILYKFAFSRDSRESEIAPPEEELDCQELEGKNTYESDSTLDHSQEVCRVDEQCQRESKIQQEN